MYLSSNMWPCFGEKNEVFKQVNVKQIVTNRIRKAGKAKMMCDAIARSFLHIRTWILQILGIQLTLDLIIFYNYIVYKIICSEITVYPNKSYTFDQ